MQNGSLYVHQVHWRARSARRLARQHRAARVVQSCWRGVVVRRAAAARQEAAVRIQTCWRRGHAQAEYQQSRACIILVRSSVISHPMLGLGLHWHQRELTTSQVSRPGAWLKGACWEQTGFGQLSTHALPQIKHGERPGNGCSHGTQPSRRAARRCKHMCACWRLASACGRRVARPPSYSPTGAGLAQCGCVSKSQPSLSSKGQLQEALIALCFLQTRLLKLFRLNSVSDGRK